jgi:predicted transcriptional regulator
MLVDEIGLQELTQRVVRLTKAKAPIGHIAKQLGVNRQTVQNWFLGETTRTTIENYSELEMLYNKLKAANAAGGD